jgi:peptidylprolyl isomerase
MRPLAPLYLLTLFSVLAGCGQSASAPAAPTTPAAANPDANVVIPSDKDKIVDIKTGEGPPVAKGDEVWVAYTGKLKNGSVFDSNDDPAKDPLYVPVGMGQVIKGWDDGLVGMRKGGERKLYVPASLGYGAKSPSEKIPPNSDLIFDVKMLEVLKPADKESVIVKDIKTGTGQAVKTGDTVEITYVATLTNGQQFDKSDKPYSFKVGADETASGIEAGVVGMRVGGERRLSMPSDLGSSNRPNVPPNQYQIFDVHLVKIEK